MPAMNAMTDESRPTLARGVRLRADPLTGEPLLLFPEGILPLDANDARHPAPLHRRFDPARDLLALSEEYEAEPDELRADVVRVPDAIAPGMLVLVYCVVTVKRHCNKNRVGKREPFQPLLQKV
jgi:hypothetical protein